MDTRTHCSHGHEYAVVGWYDPPNGFRRCKACARDSNYKSWYGLTTEDVEAMREVQAGRCGICARMMEPPGKAQFSMAVDHSHSEDLVRGLLCNSCNRGLGHFFDNPEFLASAIRWLEPKKSWKPIKKLARRGRKHGLSGHRGGCRCEVCRAANAEGMRNSRNRAKERAADTRQTW